jgi:hypothetical protein
VSRVNSGDRTSGANANSRLSSQNASSARNIQDSIIAGHTGSIEQPRTPLPEKGGNVEGFVCSRPCDLVVNIWVVHVRGLLGPSNVGDEPHLTATDWSGGERRKRSSVGLDRPCYTSL